MTPPKGDTIVAGPFFKPLDTLTPDEKKQLCQAGANLVKNQTFATTICKLQSVGAAVFASAAGQDLKASCTTAYDACIAELNEDPDDCSMPEVPNCKATVGEIEACTNDYLALLKSTASKAPSCSKITTESPVAALLEFAKLENASPASCDVIEQKCPGFLDDMDEEMQGM